MSITPFRPFVKMNNYDLIRNFWMKIDDYNNGKDSKEQKYEVNEIIKELKRRDLKLSDNKLLDKILF